MRMSASPEVIVIGAGIQGASIAFQLAQAGARTVVFEHAGQTSATSRSSGMVRMHYDLPENASPAWRSLDYFRNWPDHVGGYCGFVRTGATTSARVSSTSVRTPTTRSPSSRSPATGVRRKSMVREGAKDLVLRRRLPASHWAELIWVS